MVVPVILLVLLLLLLIVSYGVYRFVLYAPLGQQNDPFHLPNGPQYLPKYDEMYRLTKELVDLPCERVYITSQDGLQLAGDWHAGEPGHPASGTSAAGLRPCWAGGTPCSSSTSGARGTARAIP